MADDSKKYLVKICDECGVSIDDVNKVLQSCTEIRPYDKDKKSDGYIKYISEQGVVVTLLNNTEEVGNIIDEIKDSSVIVYTGYVMDDTYLKDYSHIEITKSIKWREDNKTVNKDGKIFDFLKYIIQILSDICNAGLMQGYESNNRKKAGENSDEDTDKGGDNEEEYKDEVTKLQRNKYIICNYGDAGTGKSTTLNDVISLMEVSKYTTRKNPIELIYDGSTNSKTDRYAEYEVNGVKISICTQGDPGKEQLDYIQKATQNQMDVIVCAARDDRNGVRNATTVNNVYNGTGIYVKVWYRNFFISRTETNISPQAIDMLSKSMCSTSAKGIVELIEHLMGIKIL